MAKQTLQDKLVKALEAQGHNVVARKPRYIKMSSADPDRYYFVGTKGSLRRGKSKTESRSLSETTFYASLLAYVEPEE